MRNENKYFNLFADCIPVKGLKRSTICDLGRSEIYFIPNQLYEILQKTYSNTILDILEYYNIDRDDLILEEYFEFLINNELGVWVDDISQFPQIENKWDSPAIISNAIIDVKVKKHDFNTIFNQLEGLGCEDIQIRFYEITNINYLDEILEHLRLSSIKSVELFIPYDSEISSSKSLILLTRNHPRLSLICIHGSPKNDVVTHKEFVTLEGMGRIYFIKEKILSAKSCGQINPMSFSYETIHDFFENKNFNGCLNKKISIDKNGDIKNCPSFTTNYGNVENVSLKMVVENKKFQTYSSITKDQISICKNCEFRYICTDCRAYIEDPNDLYSKPLKCGYNPNTNKWENWSKNPLKQKTIKHYGIDV
jgi:SPASM domain peptide maturase of grasp-with-spasm system